MLRISAAALLVALAAPAFAQAPPQLTYQQTLPPASVQVVQARLHEAGVYNGPADGTWGPASQSALAQFQQTHGLQATGQLNAATASALNLDAAKLLQLNVAIAAPPPLDHLSQAAVRQVQGRLRSLGLYNGALDGNWGPETQAAVTQLQQERGLQPTGQLNDPTVRAMGLDPQSLATG